MITISCIPGQRFLILEFNFWVWNFYDLEFLLQIVCVQLEGSRELKEAIFGTFWV